MKRLTPKKKARFDNIIYGLIPGLFAPLIGFLIFYLVKFSHKNFSEYFEYISQHSVISHTISLSVLPNLLIFFIFIWAKLYKSAKGVILATMIYAFAILIMRFAI